MGRRQRGDDFRYVAHRSNWANASVALSAHWGRCRVRCESRAKFNAGPDTDVGSRVRKEPSGVGVADACSVAEVIARHDLSMVGWRPASRVPRYRPRSMREA
jgi:hypothetical protein